MRRKDTHLLYVVLSVLWAQRWFVEHMMIFSYCVYFASLIGVMAVETERSACCVQWSIITIAWYIVRIVVT